MLGAIKWTKNAEIDKYGYSGYGTDLDRRGSFSFAAGRFGSNVIIFGVDMSSSVHVDNRKKKHFDSLERPSKRIGTYTDYRENVFN